MKKVTLRLTLLAAALLSLPQLASAQGYDDDLYYSPSKAAKQSRAKAEKLARQQQQEYESRLKTDYLGSDTYMPSAQKPLGMDVDTYNRRNTESTANTSSQEGSDFSYTRRIERYHNPDVVTATGDTALIQAYYSTPSEQDINVYVINNIDPGYLAWNYGWPTYTYNNPWYWNSWYGPYNPYFSFSFGFYDPWFNIGFGSPWYGPSWGWSWGWGNPWRPGWGWAWNPGWHPGWHPGHFPGHGPGYDPGHRPQRPNHGWASGASTGRRPSGSNYNGGYGPAGRPGNMGRPSNNGNHSSSTPGYRPSSGSSNGNSHGTAPSNNSRRGGNSRYGSSSSSSSNSNSGYRSTPRNNSNSSPSYRNSGSSSGSYRSSGGSYGSGRSGSSYGGGRSSGGGASRGRR